MHKQTSTMISHVVYSTQENVGGAESKLVNTMNCCEEEEVRRQRIHSENIDSQLKEDHSHVKKIINVLVIGKARV